MIDPLRLASIGAFVATGLCVISFLMLLCACVMILTAPVANLGDPISLIYLLGTIAGLCLGYAQWEYGNLRHARSDAG